jgi:amidophosphoribosyltransferase
VKLLRDAGAKEIHLRIACPPVISPCFYGVDLPTFKELAAANFSVEKIREMSGADSLVYLTIPDLIAAIGKPRKDLCLGCVTGEYPTPVGVKLAEMMKKKGFKDDVRLWEEKVI